jgi:hypothetical protein
MSAVEARVEALVEADTGAESVRIRSHVICTRMHMPEAPVSHIRALTRSCAHTNMASSVLCQSLSSMNQPVPLHLQQQVRRAF